MSITRWDDRFVSSRPLILGLSKDERSRGPQRSALADSIFQSGPVLRSVKLQVRGSTRGSRLPTFGTYRADPWQVANAASPRSCTSHASNVSVCDDRPSNARASATSFTAGHTARGLREHAEKMPSDLSGGMKKRAGLARAIALDPHILFYDEPSAGLDPVTSAEIDQLIIDLNKKLSVTSSGCGQRLPVAAYGTMRASCACLPLTRC